MKSKAALLAAILLAATTPFVLCSCSHQPTTADSAGLPAGWKGHYIQLPNAKNGLKPNQVRLANEPGSTK